MVQAVVTLTDYEDRVVNIIKGKFGLKNKTEAIRKVIDEYAETLLEPELRPEFVEKMELRQKEPTTKVKNFKEHFGLE